MNFVVDHKDDNGDEYSHTKKQQKGALLRAGIVQHSVLTNSTRKCYFMSRSC